MTIIAASHTECLEYMEYLGMISLGSVRADLHRRM